MPTTSNRTENRSQRLAALGQQIRALRKGAGLTQGQLARRIGKSTATISKIESAQQTADIATLMAIAEHVKSSPELMLFNAQLAQHNSSQARQSMIKFWHKVLRKMGEMPE